MMASEDSVGRGSRDDGDEPQARGALAGRELGRNRLGYAQAVDGSAHDATCVTRTFAARINASPWVFFQHGIIVGQSHLEVLPANHANGA